MSLSDAINENVEDTAKLKDKEPDIVDEIIEHLGLSEPLDSKALTKIITDRLKYELLITFIIFRVLVFVLRKTLLLNLSNGILYIVEGGIFSVLIILSIIVYNRIKWFYIKEYEMTYFYC